MRVDDDNIVKWLFSMLNSAVAKKQYEWCSVSVKILPSVKVTQHHLNLHHWVLSAYVAISVRYIATLSVFCIIARKRRIDKNHYFS